MNNTESITEFEANKNSRIALWNQAYVVPQKSKRYGDSYDWETVPAHFAINHPTIGIVGDWRWSRSDAERELAHCRATGEMSSFRD